MCGSENVNTTRNENFGKVKKPSYDKPRTTIVGRLMSVGIWDSYRHDIVLPCTHLTTAVCTR